MRNVPFYLLQEHKPARLHLRCCTCGTYNNAVVAVPACAPCRGSGSGSAPGSGLVRMQTRGYVWEQGAAFVLWKQGFRLSVWVPRGAKGPHSSFGNRIVCGGHEGPWTSFLLWKMYSAWRPRGDMSAVGPHLSFGSKIASGGREGREGHGACFVH